MKACKLNLPRSLSSLEVSSLLFDPLSHSLAIMLSDSSLLVFSSFPIFSPSPSPSPHTVTITPPISSCCFLHLRSRRNPADARVLFLVSGPYNGGSSVLLRFWILGKNREFVKAQVSSTQKDLLCDDNLGVVFDQSHGLFLKLIGSVNVCVLHSASARKIWVLSAKMIGDEDDSVRVHLMRCAVIDCVVPICSIMVSLGFLILGEVNGVRVFPLRPLVKGRVRNQRDSSLRIEKKNQNGSWKCDALRNREKCLENGWFCESICETKSGALDGTGHLPSNGTTEKPRVDSIPAKSRTVKLKQDSSTSGSFFVAFNALDLQSQRSTSPFMSLKAISMHALSEKTFIVLDSAGDLHLMSLHCTVPGSEITGKMRRLRHTIKVHMLAVLPDISARTQTLWISDGFHSVHTMSVSDLEVPLDENDRSESEEKQMQNSGIQAIFASEKIQDILPVAANAIMILGQGSIFAYAIS